MRGATIFSAVAVGLAVATAAPALADETDDVFISVIEAEGIPFSTPKDAIVLDHAVCDYMAAGQAPE